VTDNVQGAAREARARRSRISQATREELLAEGARLVAERWAQGWRDQLEREGRAVEGGWPGTIQEARARTTAYFVVELARRRLPSLSNDELTCTARATYDRARRDWLAKPAAGRRARRGRER
jgi:hypothetical protein